ncbi:hypothetical protein PUN28_010794 [Cardiocondyla obscurior]|uniref:Uncharacterized protein n=1 Tax=Cardiocondyla obscurior TaxID=286306 RepID=A0AAW2FI47_9HYME
MLTQYISYSMILENYLDAILLKFERHFIFRICRPLYCIKLDDLFVEAETLCSTDLLLLIFRRAVGNVDVVDIIQKNFRPSNVIFVDNRLSLQV